MAVPVAQTSTSWYAAGATENALQSSVENAAIPVTTTTPSQGLTAAAHIPRPTPAA